MIIILLLIFIVLFLYIKKRKKVYKKYTIIKKIYNKKLKIKNKLLFYNLTNFEKNLLKKVKNNFVSVKKCNADVLENIVSAGINKNFSTIKIDICECKNFNKLRKYLIAVSKFEKMGFSFNLIVLFSKEKNIFYRDVLFFVSHFNLRSNIKIVDEEKMSLKLMSLINILNIDRVEDIACETEKTEIEVVGKKYKYGFAEYKNFSYRSEISELNIYSQKIKTVDSINGDVYEKFYFENLTKNKMGIKINYVLERSKTCEQKYIESEFFKFRNYVCVNGNRIFETDTIGFDRKIISKNTIVFSKSIQLKPFASFDFLVVKSKENFKILNDKNSAQEEMMFITNKYLNLPLIKFLTPNTTLNKLLNFYLPQEIIKNYINLPQKFCEDFSCLRGNFLLEKLEKKECFKNFNFYFLPQENLGVVYQNLIYNLFGLSFSSKGVCLSKVKNMIVENAKILFLYHEKEIFFELKKTNSNFVYFTIDGVEYSNIDSISYETLIKNKNIVLHL